MSEYFLTLPGDSQPRAYSEYEVREFLGQGVIDSKTLTWKQGMEGWQPVAPVSYTHLRPAKSPEQPGPGTRSAWYRREPPANRWKKIPPRKNAHPPARRESGALGNYFSKCNTMTDVI